MDTFVTMQFTSDFQEKDIVFGGDKKLAKIMDEIQELFPLNNGITVQHIADATRGLAGACAVRPGAADRTAERIRPGKR